CAAANRWSDRPSGMKFLRRLSQRAIDHPHASAPACQPRSRSAEAIHLSCSTVEVDLNRNCVRTQSSLALAQIRLSKVESGHDSHESCLSYLEPAIPAREEFVFCLPARQRFSMANGWER